MESLIRLRRRSLLFAGPFIPTNFSTGADRALPARKAMLAATTAGQGEDAAIAIDNFTFSPALITVGLGTRVVWTNHDDIPHTIFGRDDPHTLRSPPLDTDDSFSAVFTAPGTYAYFCSLHPHMQGTVVVR